MGMSGMYKAIENSLLKQIVEGEKTIFDEDLCQYHNLNIDKSWQAIHYLHCQSVDNGKPPMGYVIPMIVEQQIENEFDMDIFYLTSDQVKEASDYLASWDEDRLKKGYDFHSMKKQNIYPLVVEDTEEEFYQYLSAYWKELKKYFRETAEQRYAMIFYIL